MNEMLARAEAAIRRAYADRAAAEPATRKKPLLVAVDGRCASGKTTLGAALCESLADIGLDVIHMDDFFLRPEQRTPERLATPGENIDHERFLEEVLTPLAEGKPFSYTKFSCSTQSLLPPVRLRPRPIMLIEGSYACHPTLRELYDLRLFLTVDPETQLTRIRARNGEEAAEVFRTRWIPLEEAYIAACAPAEGCLCLS